MADSDNSITLSSVIYRSDGRAGPVDAAVTLAGCWRRSNRRVATLGGLVDSFEKRVLRQMQDFMGEASGSEFAASDGQQGRFDEDPHYRELRDAETVAAIAEDSLIDLLPLVKAQSLDGIIAKLEIIVGADGMIEEPEAFPMPQIRSVLTDLCELIKAVERQSN